MLWQVFLPLLLEHFSEVELRRLTQVVIDLHHLDPMAIEKEEKGEFVGETVGVLNQYLLQERFIISFFIFKGECVHHCEEVINPPSSSSHTPSLLDLPPELLLKIFSYLSPSDLLHIGQLHSFLNDMAFDGTLW